MESKHAKHKPVILLPVDIWNVHLSASSMKSWSKKRVSSSFSVRNWTEDGIPGYHMGSSWMHSAVAHASVMVKIYLRFKNFPINFTYLFSIVSVIGKINHGYKKRK